MVLPQQVMDMTLDQIHLICLPIEHLKGEFGVKSMSVEAAFADGVVPLDKVPSMTGKCGSLLQRKRAQKKAGGFHVTSETQVTDKQRRKAERMRLLREERARMT